MAGLLGTQRFPTSATGKLPFSRPLSRSNPALLFFTIYLACAGSRNLISSRHGGTLGNPAVPNLRDGKTPVFPTPFPFKSCFIVFHYIFSLCWEQDSNLRSHEAPDLQSGAIDRSAIPAFSQEFSSSFVFSLASNSRRLPPFVVSFFNLETF